MQETAFFFSSNGILPDAYVTVVAIEGGGRGECCSCIYVPVALPLYISLSLSICLSFGLSLCLSVCFSLLYSAEFSRYYSISQSDCVYFLIVLYISIFLCPSLSLSLSLVLSLLEYACMHACIHLVFLISRLCVFVKREKMKNTLVPNYYCIYKKCSQCDGIYNYTSEV